MLEAGDLPSEEGGLISLFLTAVLLFPAAELATLLTPGAVVGLREANGTGGKTVSWLNQPRVVFLLINHM